jgi:hypothetical protein
MATTTKEIGDILLPLHLKFDEEHNFHWGWSGGLNAYRDKDGDLSLYVAVHMSSDGESVLIAAPNVYNLAGCPHTRAVLEALLAIGFTTKSVNYEYDKTDGEIRATVEFPIMDGAVNKEQIVRSLQLLTNVIDTMDPVVRHAMLTGQYDRSRAGLNSEAIAKRDLEDLVKQVGGLDALRSLAERTKTNQP